MSSLVSALTARKKAFYHHTFELLKQDKTQYIHTLLVNPEDFSMDEPARASTTQTLGGAYVVDFGQGLPNISITGTTGYKTRTSFDHGKVDGYEEFIAFRNKVYREFMAQNDPLLKMNWYNWEDEEFWEIQPMNFRLMRNKSAPLIYRYEFRFTGLRKLTLASKANDYLFLQGAVTRQKAIRDQLQPPASSLLNGTSILNEILTKNFTNRK